jgi:hypothetical protein
MMTLRSRKPYISLPCVMDCRVKPGNDREKAGAEFPQRRP